MIAGSCHWATLRSAIVVVVMLSATVGAIVVVSQRRDDPQRARSALQAVSGVRGGVVAPESAPEASAARQRADGILGSVPASAGQRLSGNVLDADGGPIPEATLTAGWQRFELVTDSDQRTFSSQADSSGKFAMELVAGHYRVRVAADGYAPAEYWLDLTTHLRRNFTLERAGSISGRVLADRGGAGVPGAAVVLLVTGADRVRPGGGGPVAPVQVAEVRCGPDARFQFSQVSAGKYLLVGRDGNRVGQRTQLITLERGSSIEGADVRLSEGLHLDGVVVSAGSEPVPRATVSLIAGGSSPQLLRVSDSNPEGTFSFAGLMPGVYRVDARASGFGSFLQELQLESDMIGFEIALPADTRILGHLVSSLGEPVPNAQVTVWNSPVSQPRGEQQSQRTALSRADGTFAVEGLVPGYVWLEAVAGAGKAVLGPEPVLAGEERNVEIRLGGGARISGRVQWKGGGPASDVLVRCKGTVIDRSARTDAAGDYACASLVPDQYSVAALAGSAQEPWYLSEPHLNVENHGGKNVTLSSGDQRDGIELELDPNNESISGLLLEADGTPAANVPVCAARETLGISSMTMNARAVDGRALTLDDGSFRIENLSAGIYQVRAQSSDAEARQENVPVGSRVNLTLKPTALLRGLVVDAEERPIPSFTLYIYALPSEGNESFSDVVARSEGPPVALQTFFDRDGAFEVPGLRAGAYEVLVSATGGGRASVAVALRARESRTDLKIVLGKASRVRGRVLDYDTGRPVVGCRVQAELAERTSRAASDDDGWFELSGAATGQTLRVSLNAPGYIQDIHTARAVEANAGVAHLGVLKLVRGRWHALSPEARFLDWQLEGHVEHTMIIGVRPGSSLEQMGVLPGSIVLEIGNKDARNLGPMSVHFFGSGLGAVVPLVLQLPNGSVRAFRM